jgi:hypothetical protein
MISSAMLTPIVPTRLAPLAKPLPLLQRRRHEDEIPFENGQDGDPGQPADKGGPGHAEIAEAQQRQGDAGRHLDRGRDELDDVELAELKRQDQQDVADALAPVEDRDRAAGRRDQQGDGPGQHQGDAEGAPYPGAVEFAFLHDIGAEAEFTQGLGQRYDGKTDREDADLFRRQQGAITMTDTNWTIMSL